MINPRRVVHITTVHHPLDTRIYHKECLSLQKAGYQVTLIAPEDKDAIKRSQVNYIPIKKYKSRMLRMVISTFLAYVKARELKADYYHIHDPELLPVAWLLKKKSNVVIYDIHEDYATSIRQKEYISKPIRGLFAKTYKLIEKLLSRKMAVCLAEKYYQDLYPRGTCILNYPKLNSRLINYQHDHKPAENKLIYTGNVSNDRGATIHATLPLIVDNVSVYMIGKCPHKLAKQMYEIAGDKKDQLIIQGIDRYVPREEIDHQYISHRWLAGLALFPPTEHYMKKELTKFFEYMSAGIPIICSDFPAWKAFVEKYACGIAVNPHDESEIKRAIEFLRVNQNEAKKMGENGKKAVIETLNWQAEEEKLIKWYDEIWTNKN